MSPCSFHGNWIGGPELTLLLALTLATLLAPIGIGAVIGWYRGRRHGHPWRGLLKGGAWVLGAYLGLVALWWASVLIERQQTMARIRAEEALLEPLRKVQPGGWTALLAATDPDSLPLRDRQAWTWAVVRRASQPQAWTAEDLDALGRLPLRLRSFAAGRESGHALAALVALAREGDPGLARVRGECGEDAGCLRAIDDAVASHDQMLLTQASPLLWQQAPLPPKQRAALERLLLRQRAQAMDWGNRGDARLAFDRTVRGGLSAALEACGGPLTPPTVPSGDVSRCWSELLAGLENHAPARLCPAQDGVDQADRETLHAWRAAWINDSDHAQRLGILIDGLETVCGG